MHAAPEVPCQGLLGLEREVADVAIKGGAGLGGMSLRTYVMSNGQECDTLD